MFASWLLLFALAQQAPMSTTPSTSDGAQTTAPAQLTPTQPGGADVFNAVKDVTPPRVTHTANPKWPKNARNTTFSGIVVIGLVVDAQGKPTQVHVVRSLDSVNVGIDHAAALSLDQAAFDAVCKYRFHPATKNGTPVPVALNVEINFHLD